MLGRLPIAREVGGGERGPRSGWCVVNVNADAVLLLAPRGKSKMRDAMTGSSLTDVGDEDEREMGVFLFQLEPVVGGEQLLFKGGEAGFIWPGLGCYYVSTPPQVRYQLDSATAACHHPSIMTTASIQPQRLNSPKSLPLVTLFFYAVRVSLRTHHHSDCSTDSTYSTSTALSYTSISYPPPMTFPAISNPSWLSCLDNQGI